MQYPLKYLCSCLHFLSAISTEIDGASLICKPAPSKIYLSHFFMTVPY